MSVEIVLGKRISKNRRNSFGWEALTPQVLSLKDKPIVLCLGGDGTTTPKAANAMAKYAEQLLGVVDLPSEERDFYIVSAYYVGVDASELYNSRMYHLNMENGNHSYTLEEINPSYIDKFYDDYFKNVLFDDNNNPLPVDEVKKNMRNISVFAFCHGHYVISKLEEKMRNEMMHNGYSKVDVQKVLEQVSVISIVPQSDLNKTQMTQIGFGAIDDYHFSTEDSLQLSFFYDLDSNKNSYLGVIERPLEANSKNSKVYVLDNLLDYYSENDKINVWFGKSTEELHTVGSYINMNYENKFGIKSEEGKDFAKLIARSLQYVVSNSCYNSISDCLIPLNLLNIKNKTAIGYKYGPEESNYGYQNIDVYDLCSKAEAGGKKADKVIYGVSTCKRCIEEKGGDYIINNCQAYVLNKKQSGRG